MEVNVHSEAVIAESAIIGSGVEIGPFSVIEEGVTIGDRCRIASHAILRKGTTLGNDCVVDSFAVLSGDPQSTSFDSKVETGVIIGDKVIIREGVTINRATAAGASTVIGSGCFFMAQAQVGHDCVIADEVILCNNVMIGGHVDIGKYVFFGGGVGVHQFCRVGMLAMIAGNSSISYDVPPYVMAAMRNEAHGLNLIGLRRAGFDRDQIADIKKCYKAVLFGGGNVKAKASSVLQNSESGSTQVGLEFLEFFKETKRGFIQSVNESK